MVEILRSKATDVYVYEGHVVQREQMAISSHESRH